LVRQINKRISQIIKLLVLFGITHGGYSPYQAQYQTTNSLKYNVLLYYSRLREDITDSLVCLFLNQTRAANIAVQIPSTIIYA
jgi:hypothetical protein